MARARPRPDDEEERNLLSVIGILEARLPALPRQSRGREAAEAELRAARDRLESLNRRRSPPPQ